MWEESRGKQGKQRVGKQSQKQRKAEGQVLPFARLSEAVKGYKLFIAEGKGQPSPWEQLKNQIYLGSDQFVSTMLEKIEADQELSKIPLPQRRPMPKSLNWYESSSITRNDAVESAYASGGYSMKEIGDYFGLHYSRVSRIIAKAKGKT